MEKEMFFGITIFLLTFFAADTALAGIKPEMATFAGGCFWCMESAFEDLGSEGIIDVVSGYMGGTGENPTYRDYAQKGHIETIQITYDPSKISYAELLDVFWRQIDPTDALGQFVDRGSQYRSAIFYHTQEQKRLADESKSMLDSSGIFRKPVVTEIIPAPVFYKAEEYHQDYHKKHPIKYKFYRSGSGRDQFLKKSWGNAPGAYTKPPDDQLRKKLSPLSYKVTRENATEPPFKNAYWDNKKDGIYVDIVSGEPLFSSIDKFESGTGWPSFSRPLAKENIVEKEDRGLFMRRTEVRSSHGDSHLGHVFNDGPARLRRSGGPDPAGLRYCINSAALRFIPKEELEKEGYGEFKKLFRE